MGPAIDIPQAVLDAKQVLKEFYFARGVAPYITWDQVIECLATRRRCFFVCQHL